MTLASQILSDVSEVFLDLEDFAETVQRYVGGDLGNVQQMTAVVTLDPVTVDDGRGRAYLHRANMVVASSVVINAGDAVKVGENRYEVERVGDSKHGMKTAFLTRYQQEVKGGRVFRNGDL